MSELYCMLNDRLHIPCTLCPHLTHVVFAQAADCTQSPHCNLRLPCFCCTGCRLYSESAAHLAVKESHTTPASDSQPLGPYSCSVGEAGECCCCCYSGSLFFYYCWCWCCWCC